MYGPCSSRGVWGKKWHQEPKKKTEHKQGVEWGGAIKPMPTNVKKIRKTVRHGEKDRQGRQQNKGWTSLGQDNVQELSGTPLERHGRTPNRKTIRGRDEVGFFKTPAKRTTTQIVLRVGGPKSRGGGENEFQICDHSPYYQEGSGVFINGGKGTEKLDKTTCERKRSGNKVKPFLGGEREKGPQ